MKNLKGMQVGKYNCLEYLYSKDKLTVYKGCHSKDFSLVRMNVYNKQTLGQYINVLRDQFDLFQKCKGTHILNMLQKIETKDLYIIVTDFYQCTLLDQIEKQNGLEEVDVIRIVKHKLHEFNIVYRCLEAQYVSKVGEIYVLNDLKYCKKMLSENEAHSIRNYSSPVIIAPEIYQNKKSGYEVDVWSLGVLMYKAITNQYPQIQEQFVLDQSQTKFSKLAVNFLNQTIKIDRKQRLNWKQVLKNPLFFGKSTLFFSYAADIDLDEERKMYEDKYALKQSQQSPNSQIFTLTDTLVVNISDIPQHKLKESIRYVLQEQARNQKVKNYAEELRFDYLKSMFFYEQVYRAFVNLKDQINVADRLKTQFQYLILSRSFFILSPIHGVLSRGKNVYSWEFYEAFRNHSFCRAFVQEFQVHYKRITTLHDKISTDLTKLESRFTTRITDFFWRQTNNNQYNEYKRFLIGIEGQDFTVGQFYQFLKNEYIIPILTAIRNSNNKAIRRLATALDEISRVIFLKQSERVILDNVLKNLPKA